MPQLYYQVGGFDGNIKVQDFGWSTQRIVECLFKCFRVIRNGQSLCDLLLGAVCVKNNGASSLLVTEEQGRILKNECGVHLHYSRSESDFVSISPVSFEANSYGYLTKVLDRYENKSKKNRRDKTDNSQMNKAYTLARKLPYATNYRAHFEHQRVLLRVLQELTSDIKNQRCSYRDFDITDIEPLQNLKFRSFVVNTWDNDYRSAEDKKKSPKILDIGWTEWEWGASSLFSVDLTIQTPASTETRHIVLERNRMLQLGRRERSRFEHGTSDVLNEVVILGRLKKLFLQPNNNQIILVFDEQRTREALESLGIVTKSWASGISSLLNPYKNEEEDHSADIRRRHSRSRSPHRRSSYNYDSKAHLWESRPQSPPITRENGNIFLVDIQACFKALRQTGHTLSFSEVMTDLGIEHNGWCAGNDTRTLFSAWYSMASDTAIDFQRWKRWPESNNNDNNNEPERSVPEDLGNEVSEDSDEDPNNIPVAVQQTHSVLTPYDKLEDDDYSDSD